MSKEFPYDQFYDTRPLTDETLKELGFEDDELMIGNVLLIACYRKNKVFVEIFDQRYCITTTEQRNEMDYYSSNWWRTVGKLKMLIEALKGDE